MNITNIPIDIFINLNLDFKSLLNLVSTNKIIQSIYNDENFWKQYVIYK